MQMYNEKGQVRQKEIENTQFEGKKYPRTRQFNVGTLVCTERYKEKWNKGIGTLRTRLHPVNPVTCEESRPKKYFVPQRKRTNQSLCK